MSCYPCTRCNECGMYSVEVRSVCAACGMPFPVGKPRCEACGGTKARTVVLEKPKRKSESEGA